MFSNPWKLVTRNVGGVLTIDVPNALEPASPIENADWIAAHFNRFHPWAIGSNTPYQMRLRLLVVAPGLDETRRRAPFAEAPSGLDQCSDVRWFNKEVRDGADVSTGECLHSVNNRTNESWIVDAWVPAKNIRLTLRVWKKDLDLAKACDVVLRSVASYEALPGLDAAFAKIRDAPRIPEMAFASRKEALNRALTAAGFPAPAAGPGRHKNPTGSFT